MKKFAVVLFVIVVSAGSGQARTSGMSSLSHAHFSACSDESNGFAYSAARETSSAVISSVDTDRIATPSTPCAGSS
jgi:hypothetical protein